MSKEHNPRAEALVLTLILLVGGYLGIASQEQPAPQPIVEPAKPRPLPTHIVLPTPAIRSTLEPTRTPVVKKTLTPPVERTTPETPPTGEFPWWLFSIPVLAMAFSKKTRAIIHARDKNRSVWSGGTENLECAHINHDKSAPNYDDASNGRLLMRHEHAQDHINRAERNGVRTKEQNDFAILSIIWRWLGLGQYRPK